MMDFNMSEEMILDLLKSIRKANANSKDELDLSFFQLSKGSKLDVEIEPVTFGYLGISTNSGEKVLSSSELSFHPLMINPSDFSKVDLHYKCCRRLPSPGTKSYQNQGSFYQ